jgi:acyl-coenzyme A thioesterase PaaI-like protein
MSGRDFLDAILRGALPSPPISHLVGITFERIDDGRVEMALMPQESQYNPIGSVHGGIIATVLDSVMGCATPSSLSEGPTRRWRSRSTISGASIARLG